ncbi:MAG TPA: DUF1203 domain-containing protein, partial [Mycobacteriales bacterium]|nr:DUF1203 domain-containing protein [Mycobacteriales bacterium]
VRQGEVRKPPVSRRVRREGEGMTAAQTFSVQALLPAVANELRTRDDANRQPELIVDRKGGSPLRCCLRRSRPGEAILLASYAPLRRWAAEHNADPGAYDELGPIFIHRDQCDGPSGDGWPEEFRGSPRVLRAYDANGRLLGGQLLDPQNDPDRALADLFAQPQVALVHARVAVEGCFTFAVQPLR